MLHPLSLLHYKPRFVVSKLVDAGVCTAILKKVPLLGSVQGRLDVREQVLRLFMVRFEDIALVTNNVSQKKI